MNHSRQQVSLALTAALFFAIVAPWAAVIAPLFPLLFLAALGAASPLAPLVLPFVLGSAPAFLAGILYVAIGSRLLRTGRLAAPRLHALGSALCMLSFVVWFLVLGFAVNDKIGSLADLSILFLAAGFLGAFAAIGGYITAKMFQWFVRRIGAWQQTTLGRVAAGGA